MNAQINLKDGWFNFNNYTSVEIVKYKSISNHKIENAVSINDINSIQKLKERIEKLPENGDEMKSFGSEAEQIDLVFYKEKKSQEIQIFNGRFKTPSTGFNSGKNEIETALYNDIVALLSSNR